MTSAWELAADMIDPPDDLWEPLPHQIAPPGHWFVWMLLGGRGAGKTAAAARDLYEHIHGPPCVPGVPGGHWPAIIAPTLGDGVTSCVNGPSGLRSHDPEVKVVARPGGTMVICPNGVEIKVFGAHTPEDVERLRSGGNRCYVWAEELAAWRYLEECWQHMRYGLRVGPWPHVIVSTTPKARKLIKSLVNDAKEDEKNPIGMRQTVITRATTNENPHLNARVRSELFRDYGNSRLGQQELFALILEDVEGALWTDEMIQRNRLDSLYIPPDFDMMVVAIDPAVSEHGNETGIIVDAMLRPGKFKYASVETRELSHGFTLADYSIQGRPSVWAKAALEAYHDWKANYMVAEINNGGDMVVSNIHAIDDTIMVKKVTASRGKAIRAEPVSTLYEQNRWHHVGYFPELEEQQTTWDAKDPPDDWSPDRMDAHVWGASDLLVSQAMIQTVGVQDRRGKGRR